jgi:hypothetical protein
MLVVGADLLPEQGRPPNFALFTTGCRVFYRGNSDGTRQEEQQANMRDPCRWLKLDNQPDARESQAWASMEVGEVRSTVDAE